ncbi:acyl-CoA dehydrogenase family protein [Rhodococcus sp. NPDC003383]
MTDATTVSAAAQAEELALLGDALRGTMTSTPAHELDSALADLGWGDMLTEMPDVAIPLVFRLLGETGAHAPVINDVVLHAAGLPIAGTLPLPFAGGRWIVWERTGTAGTALDEEIPLHTADAGEELDPAAIAAGRRALGWWLVGTSRTMLSLARTHALDRTQFGTPVAAFQAVRHRLAETLVAIEGAEATLLAATDDLGSLLAKAAAGKAALTAARHCQQVLGGIGFTAEHDLHRHIRRALVLDGLLGSARELTREAGAFIRSTGSAPRLVHL